MYDQIGSPIEKLFEDRFLVFKKRDVNIERQYSIETMCGEFRLDFLIYNKSYKIGIECDGRKFHDYEKDFWRDALILGTKKIEDIVRISGHKINYYLEAALYQIGKWFSWMFSERSLIVLDQLSKENFRAANNFVNYFEEKWEKISIENPNIDMPFINIIYDLDDLTDDRFLELRSKGKVYESLVTWKECFQYAKLHGSKDLERIISDYNKFR